MAIRARFTISKLTDGKLEVHDTRTHAKTVMVANRAARSSQPGPQFSRTEWSAGVTRPAGTARSL